MGFNSAFKVLNACIKRHQCLKIDIQEPKLIIFSDFGLNSDWEIIGIFGLKTAYFGGSRSQYKMFQIMLF